MTDGRLDGRLAVVLGVAVGNIGAAIARAFVAEGARVVVAGRAMGPLDAVATTIGSRAVACDITDAASVEALFAGLDGLTVAVNAAGRNLFRPFMDTTPDDVAALTAVHLTGALAFTQGAVRAMTGGGSIIHVTSLTARVVMPDHVVDMATKAAAEVLIRAAAFEFGARGIRVNGIAPALTDTPMTQAFFADTALVEASGRAAPLRRLGTVDDIAAAAVWLAGDDCFMTGEILQVNGGMALHGIGL